MKIIVLVLSLFPIFIGFSSGAAFAKDNAARLESTLQCWRYGEKLCCFDNYGENVCFPRM